MDTKILRSKILDLAFSGNLSTGDLLEESPINMIKSVSPKVVATLSESLPKNWCVIRIGDSAKYINGRAFKPIEWELSGRPIIRIQNLNDANAPFNYSSIEHEAKYLVKEGDLLFAWAASLGTYIWTGSEAWLNQHIFKVEPYTYVDKMYLHYYLEHMILEFYKLAHGSGMVHITKDKFDNSLMNLPPLAEQKRIVAKIEELLAEVEKIEQAQTDIADSATILQSKVLDLAIRGKLVPQDAADGSALDLLAQIGKERGCTIKPLTEDVPFDIPENWCWVKLGDVFEHTTGKTLNKRTNQGTILRKYITTCNVYWEGIDLSNVKETLFTEKEIEKYTVRRNDLLVCEGGDIGRSSIWESDEEVSFQNHLHRLRPYIPVDIKFYFFMFYYYKQAQIIQGKGIGMLGFSSGVIDKLSIPLPPLAEQKRIVAKVEELLKEIDKLK